LSRGGSPPDENTTTTMTRIASTALYQQVAERLRQQIFAHELTPGDWVDEQKLAEQYGISRRTFYRLIQPTPEEKGTHAKNMWLINEAKSTNQ